jgi:type VI secretion system (T6SS) effector TldE1-like protein
VGEVLLRAGLRSISAGIVAVAVGYALKSGGTQAAYPANDGWHPERPGISVVPAAQTMLSQISNDPGVRVASLEPQIAVEAAKADRESKASAFFEERFLFEERFDSFGERFSGMSKSFAPVNVVKTELVPSDLANVAKTELPIAEQPDPATEIAHPVFGLSAPKSAPIARPRATASLNSAVRIPDTPQDSVSSPDIDTRHTAIYDISARIVYLPDGRRLEAHSGLGGRLDNPRYVSVKHEGPTPPNIYRLSLRERVFHGVRAIRLTPVSGANMFGREGMLVHTYMLGPNGQSNGCVSIADYSEFLNAYLKGDIDRLVVVERLDNPPTATVASGWFTYAVKRLFKPFERDVGT